MSGAEGGFPVPSPIPGAIPGAKGEFPVPGKVLQGRVKIFGAR
jgi:hypothetical protein